MLKGAIKHQVQIQKELGQHGNKGDDLSGKHSSDDLLLVSPPSLQRVATEVTDFIKQLEEQSTASETTEAITSENVEDLVAAAKGLSCVSSSCSRRDDALIPTTCDEGVSKIIVLNDDYDGEVCDTTASEGREKTGWFSMFKQHRPKRDKSSKTRCGKLQGEDDESDNALLRQETSAASCHTNLATSTKEAWTEILDFTDDFRKFLLCSGSGASQVI